MNPQLQLPDANPQLVGRSPPMQQVRAWIERMAPHEAPVLLLGETGTGKDVVARALAAGGPRANGPFIPINCSALAESLIESELFGHERGAFTGAVARKVGAFAAAHDGTLFLDEIGELPLSMQAQLLRVIETGEVRRVGTAHAQHVDVRVIAATNRSLAREVQAGTFRADLFHRLHVLVLELPPLRQRLEDLACLAAHLLEQGRGRPFRVSHLAQEKLRRHNWPGNVRELRNVLLRASYECTNDLIEAHHIAWAELPDTMPNASRRLQDIEREAILAELQRQQGNRKAAAEALGVSRSTLHRRLHDLGLTPRFDSRR